MNGYNAVNAARAEPLPSDAETTLEATALYLWDLYDFDFANSALIQPFNVPTDPSSGLADITPSYAAADSTGASPIDMTIGGTDFPIDLNTAPSITDLSGEDMELLQPSLPESMPPPGAWGGDDPFALGNALDDVAEQIQADLQAIYARDAGNVYSSSTATDGANTFASSSSTPQQYAQDLADRGKASIEEGGTVAAVTVVAQRNPSSGAVVTPLSINFTAYPPSDSDSASEVAQVVVIGTSPNKQPQVKIPILNLAADQLLCTNLGLDCHVMDHIGKDDNYLYRRRSNSGTDAAQSSFTSYNSAQKLINSVLADLRVVGTVAGVAAGLSSQAIIYAQYARTAPTGYGITFRGVENFYSVAVVIFHSDASPYGFFVRTAYPTETYGVLPGLIT